ncbi:glycosyltransferase family 2 protein [Paenibacillus alvei]|uniref:glycosyltransferase family 2 protein n=2 Tax=Paenibacillus TaxID=44249 RepID=UPI003D2D5708
MDMFKKRRPLPRTSRQTKAQGQRIARHLLGKRKGERLTERYEYGYSLGYIEGLQAGQEKYGEQFEGTSIIIPTYNQVDVLEQCVDSIRAYTEVPYEIIVVDNASTDGTSAFLNKKSGQFRFYIHEKVRGFAGAVNTGLMMSKGTSICILNPDTFVTSNWLTNMLACLNSDLEIGMVGPVTYVLDEKQQLADTDEQMENLHHYHSESTSPVLDPSKWNSADHLESGCLLFRRSLFEETGYFDEGYGHVYYEVEDYNVRIRLSGRKLVVAQDTCIYQVVSKGTTASGDQSQSTNDNYASLFQKKWRNPYNWMHRVRERYDKQNGERCQTFYPTHVAVAGLSETVYWIEQGTKHPVEGNLTIPIVSVSQVDLRGWPTGSTVDAESVTKKWKESHTEDGGIAEGSVFTTESGRYYQRQGDLYREFMSEHALTRWELTEKVVERTEIEKEALEEGLPIMAAPEIHLHLL